MELYLVQHGEAASKDVDPARPLTARGRDEVERVAHAAHAAGIHVARVYHSGKRRAEQTAEMIAGAFGVASEALDGLAPNDDPAAVAGALDQLRMPAMLVGHLPHLSRLCGLLVTGDAATEIVRFRMGGIVCLGRDDSGGWRVSWMLTPELAPPATR